MYKFTNGIVVFDEKTRDDYLKVGYRLDIKSKKIKSQHIPAGMVKFKETDEELDENSSNDTTIERKPSKRQKVSK